MIDLTPLKDFIVEDNFHNDHIADIMIENKGFDDWFNNHIQCWCNCCFIGPSGHRLIQTNDKRYNYEITTVIHAIEKHAVDKDYYYNELINCHFNNLEYERINGFEYDSYATSKKSSTKKKTKQTSLDFGDKSKKETAAERKLKAHAAKISMLKFNIKPTNANNSL